MARPPEPNPKSVLLQVRITKDQRALFRIFAKMDSRPLSSWARLVLEETAESCKQALYSELTEQEKSNLPVLGDANGYLQGSNQSDLLALVTRARAAHLSKKVALVVQQAKQSTTSCRPVDLESQSTVEVADVGTL